MRSRAAIGILYENGSVNWTYYYGASYISELGRILMNNIKSEEDFGDLLYQDIENFNETPAFLGYFAAESTRRSLPRCSSLKALINKANTIYVFNLKSKKWFVFDWKINRFISLFSYLLNS